MIQSHSLFFLVLLWRGLHYIPALKVKGLLPGSSVAAIKHNSTRPWPVHTGEMAWYWYCGCAALYSVVVRAALYSVVARAALGWASDIRKCMAAIAGKHVCWEHAGCQSCCFIFCCGASCFRLGRRLRGSMRVGNMRAVSRMPTLKQKKNKNIMKNKSLF